MLVLASARDLVLLFVAFELMSIRLFLLTGICVRGVVGMGLYPGPWVDLVTRVASTLFA